MSDDARHIPDEVLVVTNPAKLDAAVGALVNDVSLSFLDLRRVHGVNPPPGFALVRSKRWKLLQMGNPALPDLIELAKPKHDLCEPNYVIVQMTHGRVLPISYPRPTEGELPQPGSSGVTVLVIDSPVVSPSPIKDRITGSPGQPLEDPLETSVSELHGTFVAGIIHESGPGANIRLDGFLNPNRDGFISDWELANQIHDLAKQKDIPEVVSLSLGAMTEHDRKPLALEAAIAALVARGVFVFAAAGNDGNSHDPVYPAAFEGVYSVGAQTLDAGQPRAADFSNGAHANVVDFWAPGVNVRSTTVVSPEPITFIEGPDPTSGFADLPPSEREDVVLDGWACWDGTSFATPIVAAACANQLIASNADPIATLRGMYGAQNNDTGFTGNGLAPPCEEATPNAS